MSRARIAAIVVAGCFLISSIAIARERSPRFYFDVRGVQLPAGAKPSLKERAGKVFLAELKKQPQVVTDLGDPRPQGEELQQTLKARKLEGYALVLRVTKSAHSLHPPAPGKVYKTLAVEVEVAIDAEKIPSGQLALAGEGTVEMKTEVRQVKEKEKDQLLAEALAEAVQQAVGKSILKLSSAAKPVKRPARKKR